MDTAETAQQTDPRHVLVARADEGLAHAHEQITRAAEEIARAEEQLSKLDAASGNRGLFDRPAVRGLTGLLLAACIGVAAIASHSSYGDAAKEIIARWTPQRIATSSPPLETLGLAVQPSPPAVQPAAAKIAPSQPALLAQSAPEDVAPTAAVLPPELKQLLQSMARDLATLGQGIEQLKAGQEQMARDNANTAEQLRASREQMARIIASSEAKASEARAQSPRPRISAPPPRPTATPTRRPPPTP
jgi:hypothetical protein